MKTIKSVWLAMIALSLAACSSNDPYEEPGTPDDTAKEGYIMIKISPSATSRSLTRANDPGTDAEKLINSLHVYLFDTDGASTTVAHFNSGDFTTTSGVTSLNAPIKTTIKDKKVFIGVNLNDAMKGNINSSQTDIRDEYTHDIGDLANATAGFVMFTDEKEVLASQIMSSETDANTNPVTGFELRRVTSKANVFYDGTVFAGPGTYAQTEAEFAWRRISKNLYYIQKNNYADPHFNPGEFQAANRNDAQAFVSVNVKDALTPEFQYTTENTFDFSKSNLMAGDATCITVRIPFQPNEFTKKNGGIWEAVANANAAAPAYDAPDFYVVKANMGIVYYFETAQEAEEFFDEAKAETVTIGGIKIVPDVQDYEEQKYANGVCYYNVYPTSNLKYGDQYKFNIMRNQYFRLALKKLTAPGLAHWDDDAGNPITESGYVQFELTVQDWELFNENIYQ